MSKRLAQWGIPTAAALLIVLSAVWFLRGPQLDPEVWRFRSTARSHKNVVLPEIDGQRVAWTGAIASDNASVLVIGALDGGPAHGVVVARVKATGEVNNSRTASNACSTAGEMVALNADSAVFWCATAQDALWYSVVARRDEFTSEPIGTFRDFGSVGVVLGQAWGDDHAWVVRGGDGTWQLATGTGNGEMRFASLSTTTPTSLTPMPNGNVAVLTTHEEGLRLQSVSRNGSAGRSVTVSSRRPVPWSGSILFDGSVLFVAWAAIHSASSMHPFAPTESFVMIQRFTPSLTPMEDAVRISLDKYATRTRLHRARGGVLLAWNQGVREPWPFASFVWLEPGARPPEQATALRLPFRQLPRALGSVGEHLFALVVARDEANAVQDLGDSRLVIFDRELTESDSNTAESSPKGSTPQNGIRETPDD